MPENIFLIKAIENESVFLRLDNFDSCIIGLTFEDLPIYSYSKMINHIMKKESCSLFDAIDWICSSIVPLQGENSFSICYDWT